MKIILLISVSICSLNFSYSQKQTSDTLKTKPLVIKSNSTTDPNYKKNLEKSAKVNKQLSNTPQLIIKNDEYYKSNIQSLKNQIKKIKETPNKEGVNPDKLENLIKELESLEKEYATYLKTQNK